MAPRTLFLALANLLIPVAILVFASGFFPYKPFMPGLAEYEALFWEENDAEALQEPPEAPFDKLVFMVVDALRSDFVYGEESGMGFVQRYNILSRMVRSRISLTILQPHSRRHSRPIHSPRYISYHHYAACKSHYHRLYTLLSRRDSQLCRIRHILDTSNTRYLASTDQSQTVWR